MTRKCWQQIALVDINLGVLGRPLHVEEGGIIFARLGPGSAGTSVMWPATENKLKALTMMTPVCRG